MIELESYLNKTGRRDSEKKQIGVKENSERSRKRIQNREGEQVVEKESDFFNFISLILQIEYMGTYMLQIYNHPLN